MLYANANLEEIYMDMAKGEGEVLEGLANVMGCEGKVFNEITKSRFEVLGQTNDPVTFLENVHFEIQKDPALSKACGSKI